MTSLPFISHHLFVAAIGNDDRGEEKPARHERPFVTQVDQASPMALVVMEARKPLPEFAAGTSRVGIAQAVT